jgi:protein O-mannosyl-transferase
MANPNWKLTALRVLLIVVAGFWVFSPALLGGWLMDDDFYLTQNVLLNDPARLWKIWFAPGSLVEYYPIEASVQAIQWSFWGPSNTLGYHLTNLLLHLSSALLVWRLLAKFGLRLAWLGGFLFAIHPAMVESVAWISELKNTLSLPVFLLSMCAWIDYEKRGRPSDYFRALGFFVAAMLCKISMALFPFVLLLYAWWRRGRIGWGDLRNALPFAVISLGLILTTIFAGNWFEKSHFQSSANPDLGNFLTRFSLAGQSIAFYFGECAWPLEVLPIHPKWCINPESPLSYLPWFILAFIMGLAWIRRTTWGRHALLGLGFFLINLLPFIGFKSISYLAFTWVMDHFLYISIIGLIGLAVAALGFMEIRASASVRPVIAGAIAVTLALLAWESHNYADVFDGPEKQWTYTITYNPGCWLAHNNLGNVYLQTNRITLAIDQYEKSLAINPASVEASNNLGFALVRAGRIADAIPYFEQSLKVNPHFPLAHANLADALAQLGRIPEAIVHYQEALRINPNDRIVRGALAKLQSAQKTP